MKKDKKNERITLLVSEETKKKWQEFAEKNDFTSISKFIRKAVDFYIVNTLKISLFKNINKISHELKEPLTIINGLSHIILENYSEKMDPNILIRIKEIHEQSKALERKIDEIFLSSEIQTQDYDILIVDDNASTILLLKDFFEIKGFHCKGVNTGQKCLEEIEKNLPKLILIDILLPDIDGFKLGKILKSKISTIPIYFITAIPHTEVMKKLKETGVDGCFLKPFDFNEFNSVLEKLKIKSI
ncbi:MAG: response regulator [Promethearchaeota archaeon]